MRLVEEWTLAVVRFMPEGTESVWQHRPSLSRTLSQISYSTCLALAQSFDERRFSLFVNPDDELNREQASVLCKEKKWQLVEAEYLGLDLSLVDLAQPQVLEFSAEFENQSISRETVRSRGDFLRSDKSGLRDFVKLMSIPSRNRVYIGRTMRHGKTTFGYAGDIQNEFSEFVNSSILAKRAVSESDSLEVLLVFMRERKISWPTDCVVGVGAWYPSLSKFKWEDVLPF